MGIKLFYGNINIINDQHMTNHLETLPLFMREEIVRYAYLPDQKSRLLARLMLYQSLKDDNKLGNLSNWTRDANNKPSIKGWDFFNISHSGEWVVFAHGNTYIGVDIEKIVEFDYSEIIDYFHPEEQEFIKNAADIQRAFYEVWVKKEAFLKAIGIGIGNGLKEFSCVNEKLNYKGNDWHLSEIDVIPGYITFFCSLIKQVAIFPQESM